MMTYIARGKARGPVTTTVAAQDFAIFSTE
jgi:hypothetical protein